MLAGIRRIRDDSKLQACKERKTLYQMSGQSNPNAPPWVSEFIRVKEAHPDCLVFFRMGDFFEAF
jgi:hypothetical protein